MHNLPDLIPAKLCNLGTHVNLQKQTGGKKVFVIINGMKHEAKEKKIELPNISKISSKKVVAWHGNRMELIEIKIE